MAECEVCCDVFDKGLQCPKILPCIHTLCVRCLRKLEKYGQIQCPFDRIFHRVPIGGVEKFPTNQQVLKRKLAEKNKNISPSLGGASREDSRAESCKLHGKPLIIDDEIYGKFCETGLIIASSVLSQRKSVSEEHLRQRSNYERQIVRNRTWNVERISMIDDESRFRADFSRLHIGQESRICRRYGKASISVIYNALDGTENGFCETCLNLDSSFMVDRYSGPWEQTGHGSSDQHSQRPRNNTSTRNSRRGRKNEVGVFGTVRRLRTGLPIYQQSQGTNFATNTENEGGICVFHGKRLIIYNETDGRFCETCRNPESLIMTERQSGSGYQTGCGSSNQLDLSQSSRNNASARNITTGGEDEGARCPLHRKPLIRITYNLIDGTVQRLCETCLNPDSSTVSQRESTSGTNTEQDSRICASHGKPLIIYNETDGRFCETCLNLNSSILSLRETSDQQPQSSEYSSSNKPQVCEVHGIPLTRHVIRGTRDSFCEECSSVDSDNIMASESNSSRESHRISNRTEICEEHGQPFTKFTYDVGHGEQRRFCKACFNPGSNTISVPDVVNPDTAAISSSISTLQ